MASEYIGGGVATPVVESTYPHTSISEAPAPIQALQPPASNAGSDDPTGGLPKGAGGLSSTAGIGSPVPAEAETQSIVGSVLAFAFGKRERTAAEVEALAPTTSTVTTADRTTAQDNSSSGGYLGAIAGVAAAGGAAVASVIPGMASTTGSEPHAHTTSSTSTTAADPVSGSAGIGSVNASEPPSSSTTGRSWVPAATKDESYLDSTTTDETTSGADKSLGEKASEVAQSAKTGAAQATESVADTTAAAAQSVKETVSGDKTTSTSDKTTDNTTSTDKTVGESAKEAVSTDHSTDDTTNTKKKTGGDAVEKAQEGGEETEDTEGASQAKKVSDYEAAHRENKDAIPTAGGEKLGAAHAGESKIIPDNPAPPKGETSVSSSAGQPDSTTTDNTAKNTGGAHNSGSGLPPVAGRSDESAEGTSDKPKLMDRLKNKLHIGEKEKK